jgi:hypothetical protein
MPMVENDLFNYELKELMPMVENDLFNYELKELFNYG